jgi:hypothetical protein
LTRAPTLFSIVCGDSSALAYALAAAAWAVSPGSISLTLTGCAIPIANKYEREDLHFTQDNTFPSHFPNTMPVDRTLLVATSEPPLPFRRIHGEFASEEQ